MVADEIKSRIENVWQDASVHWKDELAHRYHAACILELVNILENIRVASVELSESADIALSSLRKYNY